LYFGAVFQTTGAWMIRGVFDEKLLVRLTVVVRYHRYKIVYVRCTVLFVALRTKRFDAAANIDPEIINGSVQQPLEVKIEMKEGRRVQMVPRG
jgi:hypothetical protein